MAKHSLGPWRLEKVWSLPWVVDGDDEVVVAFSTHGFRIENARLIAAAPELLEELKDLLGIHHGECKFGSICRCQRATALIRRIEGEAKGDTP